MIDLIWVFRFALKEGCDISIIGLEPEKSFGLSFFFLPNAALSLLFHQSS